MLDIHFTDSGVVECVETSSRLLCESFELSECRSFSLLLLWLSMQEYLRMSDVYRMYGNASLQPHSSSPAALHCLSLTVTPALPTEVDLFSALCNTLICFSDMS